MRYLMMFSVIAMSASAVSFAENWPRFRGVDGTGAASDNDSLPMSWSTTENVAWLADVPGWGWSSPVVWGDKVFLTTVVSDQKNLTPSKGLYLGEGVRDPAKGTHHWVVYCFDLNSGEELWSHEAHMGEPQIPRHPKSTYAAETPVTDGERLYVLFGDVGLYCYDMSGKPLWSKLFDPRKTFMDYGAAASPVVHGDNVFVVYDNLESSWIAAFDSKTGKERWKKARKETHSWATPLIWENESRTELVVPGKNRNISYSLDGEELWSFNGRMSNLVIPSPMVAHGLCYIASGYIGDSHRPTFAIKPGGSGDLAAEGTFESEYIEWYQGKSSPYNPSQIVYGDFLYTCYDRGFLTCHDAKTGSEVYGKRRFTPSGSFASSPFAYNGHLFFLSEDGLTYVVKAGRSFEIVGRNDLEELCMACPAVVGNKLLVRTASKLYCLTKGASLDPSVAAKMKPRREAKGPEDIWTAARTGDTKTIKRLLDEGFDVNARQGGRGSTALNLAAVFGQNDAARLMLNAGADVSIANSDGNTALHIAAFFGNVPMVRMLLKNGASAFVRNVKGETPAGNVSAQWSEELEATYKRIGEQIGKEFEFEKLKAQRTEIKEILTPTKKDESQSVSQTVHKLPDEVAAKTTCLNPEFLVSEPEGYGDSKSFPLMIFLHGRGERGDELNRVKKHGPPKFIEAGKQFPFIVVSPQCLTLDDNSGSWRTDDLKSLLDHVEDKWKVDADRIYVTGLSMGGFATWAWSVAEPDRFAAVAPICGGANPQDAWAISHIPIWTFHGAKDFVVPIKMTKGMVDELKSLDSDVRFTVYSDAGHDSWTESYNNDELYSWLQQQTLTLTRARRKSTLRSEAASAAKKLITDGVENGSVVGASHLVVHGNRTVHFAADGVADVENDRPFSRDTIVRIYSMTKAITSVAAMTLYEKGKFQLDDPVSKFIPAFKDSSVGKVVDGEWTAIPPKRPITIRDVLRHTTGYSYGTGNPRYAEEGMTYHGPGAMYPPQMTIEAAADALAKIPANHHPGEQFTYGFSTDLLGRLIEVWSDKKLGDYLKDVVCRPLGMKDTAFSVEAAKRRRFATCHTMKDGDLAVLDKSKTSPFAKGFEFESGGGGLLSTIDDYARFCRMMANMGSLEGTTILKPETVKLMFTDQLNGVAGPLKFGLGFAISKVKLGEGDDQREVTEYRWGGYASTDFRIIPEEQLFQIFFRQMIPSQHGLADKAMVEIYRGLKKQ